MITSKDNELVKEISKLISSAKARREKKLFVAEGIRLCSDAAVSGVHIVHFLYTEDAASSDPELFGKIKELSDQCTELSRQIMVRLSDTEHPQGFMCLIDSESAKRLEKIEKTGRYLALENIQDPSNLGTMLRTAEALGVDGVILSSGCCDIFSPKVVRGSMGAVFRLPFVTEQNFTGRIGEYWESIYFLPLALKHICSSDNDGASTLCENLIKWIGPTLG